MIKIENAKREGKMGKENNYRITVEQVDNENESYGKSVQFEVQDREDMFRLMDILKKGSGLDDQNAIRVAVALRLLGPVMMKERKNPIFIDFMPHFKTFMQNLKNLMKEKLDK